MERTSARPRWPTFAVVGLVLAAFGPYVFGGIRTEQAGGYGIFLVGATGLWWRKSRPTGSVVAIVLLLTVQLIVAAIGVFYPIPLLGEYQPGDPIAGIDNLLLPIVVIATVSWLAHRGDRED